MHEDSQEVDPAVVCGPATACAHALRGGNGFKEKI